MLISLRLIRHLWSGDESQKNVAYRDELIRRVKYATKFVEGAEHFQKISQDGTNMESNNKTTKSMNVDEGLSHSASPFGGCLFGWPNMDRFL